MENILKAAKCIECGKILRSPVLLPCGISVCEVHITEQLNPSEFACASCGLTHEAPKGGFFRNHTCEVLIDTYFGEKHQRALTACHRLAATIDEYDTLDKDADGHIQEAIEEMREHVHAKCALIKAELDEKCAELMAELDAYQSECKSNVVFLRASNVLGEIGARFEEPRVKVTERLAELNNSLEANSQMKWESIAETCELEAKQLFSKLNEAKNMLLLNRLNEFKAKESQFTQLVLSRPDELWSNNSRFQNTDFQVNLESMYSVNSNEEPNGLDADYATTNSQYNETARFTNNNQVDQTMSKEEETMLHRLLNIYSAKNPEIDNGNSNKMKRCRLCDRRVRDRKSKITCNRCARPVCCEHSRRWLLALCNNCFSCQ